MQQATAAWYRRSRALDITGSHPRDSLVLTATGQRSDSLAITMEFYVNAKRVHTQRWKSQDELADADSFRTSATKRDAFMRRRLDDVLKMVKREPLKAEQVQHMGDVALLKRVVPKPTHQIALSFGYENSLYFVWNPATKRLVLFMECC